MKTETGKSSQLSRICPGREVNQSRGSECRQLFPAGELRFRRGSGVGVPRVSRVWTSPRFFPPRGLRDPESQLRIAPKAGRRSSLGRAPGPPVTPPRPQTGPRTRARRSRPGSSARTAKFPLAAQVWAGAGNAHVQVREAHLGPRPPPWPARRAVRAAGVPGAPGRPAAPLVAGQSRAARSPIGRRWPRPADR